MIKLIPTIICLVSSLFAVSSLTARLNLFSILGIFFSIIVLISLWRTPTYFQKNPRMYIWVVIMGTLLAFVFTFTFQIAVLAAYYSGSKDLP